MARKIVTFVLLAAASAAIYAPVAQACNVPVFRFGLERWMPDIYEVLVIHDKKNPLSDEQKKTLQTLQALSSEKGGATNIRVHTIHLDTDKMAAPLQALWDAQSAQTKASLPLLLVSFPTRRAKDGKAFLHAAWAGPLTPKAVAQIANSPMRKKIAEKILDGATAVWIFRDGKDPVASQKAYEELKKQLAVAEKTIKLPVQEKEASVKLLLDFPVLRLSREGIKAEPFLNASLLESEPGPDPLSDCADQPMAFPVFGRGRVLFAFVGAGINEENIIDACDFLTGPCGCQIKAQNPGWDMVFTVKWDDHITDTLVKDEDITNVELMGLPSATAVTVKTTDPTAPLDKTPAATPKADTPVAQSTGKQDESGLSALWISAIAAGGILLMALLIGEIIRRKKSNIG